MELRPCKVLFSLVGPSSRALGELVYVGALGELVYVMFMLLGS